MPARAGRHEGVLPADRGRARRPLPRGRDGLPRLRRSDKPIGAPYDAAWFAPLRVPHPGRARGRTGGSALGREQHGRPGGDRGRVDRSATGCAAWCCCRPALAWLRDRRWAPVVRLLRPELGLLQVTPRPVVERVVRRLVPGGGARLGGRGRRRVPARLPDPARPGRLLRGRAQHLPGRAARRRRLLGAPGRPGAGLAVRLGAARHARADRVHEARRAGAADGAPRRARLRPRAAAGAAARDARGDGWTSCGRGSGGRRGPPWLGTGAERRSDRRPRPHCP